MYDSRLLPLAALAFILLSSCLTGVSSQGLMGGFKGHHHRGTGAVELLLATGILAKLLNHRAKHGPSYAARHIMHAILGPRYPPRYTHGGRNPLDSHPSLLQDDLLEPHGAMALPLSQDELLLNQETALLTAKSPFLMNHNLAGMGGIGGLGGIGGIGGLGGMGGDSQLLAEAQITQQLLAARRARKMLEARKILAAQEAKNLLVQREAAQILAAQEAAQAASYLTATPSRQILTAAPPPRMMSQQMAQQMNQQINQQMNQQMNQLNKIPQGQGEMMMGSERSFATRSDTQLFSLPPGLNEREMAEVISRLANSDI